MLDKIKTMMEQITPEKDNFFSDFASYFPGDKRAEFIAASPEMLQWAVQEIDRKDEEIKSWVKRYNDNFAETLKIVKRRDQLQQELELKESEYQATMDKYHMASKLEREYQAENNRFRAALEQMDDSKNPLMPRSQMASIAREALKGSP